MAAGTLDSPSLTGWYIGYVIGGVAITAVVVLVAIILTMARRIAVQAEDITKALDASRMNTQPLWDVAKVNMGLSGIVGSARAARTVLERRL